MKAGKVYAEGGVVNIEILDDDDRVVDIYGILFSECQTSREMCNWVRQLGEKLWVDKETLVKFAQCVLRGLGE